MRALMNTFLAAAASTGALLGTIDPSYAACTRLGFSVNDYGKDGPTKDAKELLDKYIAKKMAERGVVNYRVGKKDVNCELFLDFIVFDEHTCRADATVCWDEGAAQKPQAAAAPAPALAAPVAKSDETPTAPPAETTGSIEKPDVPSAAAPAAVSEPTAAVPDEAAPVAAEATPAAPVDEAAPTDVAPVEAVQP